MRCMSNETGGLARDMHRLTFGSVVQMGKPPQQSELRAFVADVHFWALLRPAAVACG